MGLAGARACGSRGAVLRWNEQTRFSSASDDEVGGSEIAIRASAASNQTQRADGCLTRLAGPLANQSESYMLFSTSAYFFSTALRRTFRVGVTSPSSTLNSEGKISNRLMVSQRSRDWLASVT